MNIQELQTLVRDRLAVNVIVLNNHCLGMIRKTQEKLFNGKDFISVKGYEVPSFKAIAEAYGLKYLKIEKPDEYFKVKEFLSDCDPRFIEVDLPMIMENMPEPGSAIELQMPLLSQAEYELISKECRYE